MSLILVFEPDSEARGRIESALTAEGWSVELDETSPGRTADLVVLSGDHPEAGELARRFARSGGGPGVLLLEGAGSEAAGADVEGRLEKPFGEQQIRAAVRRCLSRLQREAAERAAREAASSGEQLTSADLFGDMLAEVEDEVAAGAPEAPEPPPVGRSLEEPSAERTAPRRRPSSDEALDAEIERTLSGVLDLGGRKSKAADSGTKARASRQDDEVDALLSQTLSGLGVGGARRRAERETRQETGPPPSPVVEAPAEPEPPSAVGSAPAEAPPVEAVPSPAEPVPTPGEPAPEPQVVARTTSSAEPEAPAAPQRSADPLATQRMEAIRDLPPPVSKPKRGPSPKEVGTEETFGQYTMLERVAVGGMAEVWKARMKGMEGFQKTVAIKRILPHLTDSSDFVTMFIDEAKLAAQLNHPHIIHIYDLGKIDSDYYIAMEYVEGKDLRSILTSGRERGEPLSLGLSLLIAARLASALDHAHRKRDFEDRELGLVHRDVSPQNVLISYEGDIKLCDFGIVKAVAKASKTQMGALKGKLQYMSPEQAWGRVVDARSDIFSLGAVFFEMLTGDRLFAGDSELSVLEAVRDCRVRSARELNAAVPEDVEAILRKALRKDPDERYQTASDFQKDLEKAIYALRPTPSQGDLARHMERLFEAEHAPSVAATVARESAEAPPPGDETGGEVAAMPPVGEIEREEGRPGKGLWLGIAAALLLVLGVVGWLVFAPAGSGEGEKARGSAATEAPAAVPVPAPSVADPLESDPVAGAAEEGAPEAPAADAADAAEDVDLQALVDAEIEDRDEALKARFEEERRRLEAEIAATREARQSEDEKAPAEPPQKAPVTSKAEPEPEPEPPPATPPAAMAEATPDEPEPQAAAAGPPTSQAPSRDRAAQNPETVQEAPSPAQDPQTKAKRAEPPAAKAPAQEQVEVPEPARPRVTRGQLVDASTPGLAAPRLVSIEKPQYPPIARRMQVQGTVVVSVLVGETGAVEDVRLVQGVSQDVGLNEAALKAARSARFSPASVDDVPVKMWFNLRIPFQL